MYKERSIKAAGTTNGTAFEMRCPQGTFITYLTGGGLGRHIAHITGICSDGTLLASAGLKSSVAAFDSATQLQVAAGAPEPGTFSFRSDAGFKSLKIQVGSMVESLSFQTLDNSSSPVFLGLEAESAAKAQSTVKDTAWTDRAGFDMSCANKEKIVALHGGLDGSGLVALGVVCGRLRVTGGG
jgi:hypothetical protein